MATAEELPNSLDPRPVPRPGGTLAVFHLAEASGPSISLRNELAWLASAGPVEVVVPALGRAAEEFADFAKITVLGHSTLTAPAGPVELAVAAARFLQEIRVFRRHIRRTRPTRVVAVTTGVPAAMVAARLERVPLLVYVGEFIPVGPGLGRRMAGTLLLRMIRSLAGALLCCSEVVAAQFAGASTTPVVTAYPPIAAGYAGGDGDALRRRLGIPPQASCVAAVGAISWFRGFDVLVRALPELTRRFPGLRLIVAGEPHPRSKDLAYRDEVVALARELGVAEALVMAGFVESVGDLYAAVDAVVNPARREPLGRVAGEALVAGRPVVSTRVGGVPEVLRDGIDALLVSPGDPNALADALTTVLSDKALSARLVAAGRERVLREFSEERSLAGFAEAVAALEVDGRR